MEVSGGAQIACLSSSGCSSISIHGLAFTCRNNSKAVFQVRGCSLSISMVSFVGCRSDADGGVIQAYDLAKVVIEASNFTDVQSSGFGGAIAAYGSSLSVSNSVLRNCSSQSGGGAIWAAAFPDCFDTNQANNTYLHISASVFILCHTGRTRLWLLSKFQRQQLAY